MPEFVSITDVIKKKLRGYNLAEAGDDPNPIIRFNQKNRRMKNGKHYDIAKVPFFRQVFDDVLDDRWKVIAVMGPTQFGKTEGAISVIMHAIAERPTDILFYGETEIKCKMLMKDRIAPALQQEPFSSLISESLEKGMRGSTYSVQFAGGSLHAFGAKSPNSFRSMPGGLIFADEFSAWENNIGAGEGEGSPLGLLLGRTHTHGPKAKVLIMSTPTTQHNDEGSFYNIIQRGDQNEYHTPCPYCKKFFLLSEETFKYATDKKGVVQAWHVCPNRKCKKKLYEHDKDELLSRGKWIAKNPKAGGYIRSYKVSGFHSARNWLTWVDIAQNAIEVAEGGDIKTYRNTKLGLPYSAFVETPNKDHILKQFELNHKEGELPDWVKFVTCGIDIQGGKDGKDGWGQYLCVGFGKNGVNAVIKSGVINSDIRNADGAEAYRKVIRSRFKFAGKSKKSLPILLTAIDTGYESADVMRFISEWSQPTADYDSGIWRVDDAPSAAAVRGVSFPSQKEVIHKVSGERRPSKTRRALRVYSVATDLVKLALYSRLNDKAVIDKKNLPDSARSYQTFFPKGMDAEFYEQLLSEEGREEQNARGQTILKFVNVRKGRRNESLDCYCYARAAAEMICPNYKDAELQRLYDTHVKEDAPVGLDAESQIPKKSWSEAMKEAGNDDLYVKETEEKKEDTKAVDYYSHLK